MACVRLPQDTWADLDRDYLISLRGYETITLTEWTTYVEPKIAQGSKIEVDGELFEFSTDTAIADYSTVVNEPLVYLAVTKSGSNLNAYFTTQVPSFDPMRNGWYHNNDRYLPYRLEGEGINPATEIITEHTLKDNFVKKAGVYNGNYYMLTQHDPARLYEITLTESSWSYGSYMTLSDYGGEKAADFDFDNTNGRLCVTYTSGGSSDNCIRIFNGFNGSIYASYIDASLARGEYIACHGGKFWTTFRFDDEQFLYMERRQSDGGIIRNEWWRDGEGSNTLIEQMKQHDPSSYFKMACGIAHNGTDLMVAQIKDSQYGSSTSRAIYVLNGTTDSVKEKITYSTQQASGSNSSFVDGNINADGPTNLIATTVNASTNPDNIVLRRWAVSEESFAHHAKYYFKDGLKINPAGELV